MFTIFHVTPSYKPAYIYGGPTLSVSKLCEELHKSDINVRVLTTTANGKNELQVNTSVPNKVAQVEVFYFKRWTKDHSHFSPALLLNLAGMIKEHKQKDAGPLIIHIHSWWNTVAMLSSLIAWWYRIPLVVSPRGMLTAYSQQNKHVLYKRLIHKSLGNFLLRHSVIHATSEQEKQDVNQTTKGYRGIAVIPNFVKYPSQLKNVQAQNQPSSKSVIKLLFLSRIEEKKGLDLLIKALPELQTNWHLTIAGQGDTIYIRQLQQMAADLGVDRHISWIGELNNTRKFEVYKNNDLFILPSHNENFANVVIESLAMGTPVLVTREVGLAPYVLTNNLGWITALQPKEIAKAIDRATTEYQKRARIRREAPKLIRKDFTENALVMKYTAMYHQILEYVN